MENVGKFLSACEAYGLEKQDLFQTVDLYEAQNMPQVCQYIIIVANNYYYCDTDAEWNSCSWKEGSSQRF